ncbi:1,3-beta-glucanosyltransferase [Kluyveromyces lactis]|uniref:1,3-beta-glucanosyltransferase n=1 Tax=Kluyveromyces lactis (strain ATCC 8585 / CBS 2359 / DSM 70799 / NBRC 1267 / NRRL Y-1140 / WM37) TaxID=284590 RepID=Q6CW95_KLULA|nr:uncharacterized protein KLLA0_B05808g [Kluyveromyces lactis]CAH02187.1 KLLA0B05808p [Kluyveromyces lactis]|eukprot:XP_451794.1 uncharacterized protein KLLA0_B05808g [Kluyveromyces lactis]
MMMYCWYFLCLLQRIVGGEASDINSDLPTIQIAGNKFFNSKTGEQFFLKGIAYQPSRSLDELTADDTVYDTTYIDPLADTSICLRDLPYLTKLHVNTVRVYSVDPTKDHDECMNAFAEAGIYVLLDLSEPDVSISRDSPSWDVQTFQRYKDVVDSMSKYDNILGYFAGNEVTNDKTNTDASPFVKASIRDIKKHIESKGYRKIPVGYSTNDDSDTRDALADYFVCGEYAADFYGINMYEWCGYSSYGGSGYRERTIEFKNFPVPVFFSEFGCNAVRPRPFTEVGALYGPLMTPVWSGGLVYMYFEEENEYGVVKVTKNGQVIELEDFKYLQNEFEKAKPKTVSLQKHLESEKPAARKCPQKSKLWKASLDLPPEPDFDKCKCLEELLPCLSSPFKESKSYKSYFDYVCAQIDCSDISNNGAEGEYGEFADCNARQKLSLQLSKLYYASGKGGSTCPLANEDIYFNFKSYNTKTQCQALIKSVQDSVNTKKSIKVPTNDQDISNLGNSQKICSILLLLTAMTYTFFL